MEILEAKKNGLDVQRSVSLRKVRQIFYQTFIRGNFTNAYEVVEGLSVSLKLSYKFIEEKLQGNHVFVQHIRFLYPPLASGTFFCSFVRHELNFVPKTFCSEVEVL